MKTRIFISTASSAASTADEIEHNFNVRVLSTKKSKRGVLVVIKGEHNEVMNAKEKLQ